MLDTGAQFGGETVGEMFHALVGGFRIHSHLLHPLAHHVPQDSHRQRQILVDQITGLGIRGTLADGLPETTQEEHVGAQGIHRCVLAGGPDDVTTLADLIHELPHRPLQPGPLVLVLDASGQAHALAAG